MSKARRKVSPANQELIDQVIQIRMTLRALRKEKHLTAAEMSQRMGISRPFYTQLEGGTRRLSVYYLLGIARAMGVSVAQLLP